MSGLEITDVLAWEALDSRGRPTVGCRVTTAGGGLGRCVVPSGASTGRHEAVELRDGGERHVGQGVRRAVENVNTTLRSAVVGAPADEQEHIDLLLEGCDPGRDLSGIGANAVLAVSLATLLAASDTRRVPLYESVATGDPDLPMPMINILSGGAHAAGAIDIQDVLAVPSSARDFAEAIEIASAVRACTARALTRAGFDPSLVADEGGLAAPLASNRAAVELVLEGIEQAGLLPGRDAHIAIDLAANQLAGDGGLRLRSEGRTVSYTDWIEELSEWVGTYPICSLEDILPDDAWAAWEDASRTLRDEVQLLGDDLFATDVSRVRRGIEQGIGNAVLVKLNQAGTVSRARRVMDAAAQAGFATVVSARSGDSEDSWLADLAVGWRAGQIKVGSLMRAERTAKWNRLLEIEAMTGAPLRPWRVPEATPRAE